MGSDATNSRKLRIIVYHLICRRFILEVEGTCEIVDVERKRRYDIKIQLLPTDLDGRRREFGWPLGTLFTFGFSPSLYRPYYPYRALPHRFIPSTFRPPVSV
jgi:hypothetical protein